MYGKFLQLKWCCDILLKVSQWTKKTIWAMWDTKFTMSVFYFTREIIMSLILDPDIKDDSIAMIAN